MTLVEALPDCRPIGDAVEAVMGRDELVRAVRPASLFKTPQR